MFAPRLYTVRKFSFSELYANSFNWELTNEQEKKYYIKQQDNMLFRQIRLITHDYNNFNKYVIFVDCKGGKTHESALSDLVMNGFYINNVHYVLSERSASMTRNFILSFVNEEIIEELNKRITMDIEIDKTVLSKYYAYRGLMFSSCHCLENWFPKIIIVPDYFATIPNQKIKYVHDETTSFTNKEGNEIEWTQKAIDETMQDIKINVFDGCGIGFHLITYGLLENYFVIL